MKINEFITPRKVTLNQLYGGDFPDRHDTFWDYVRSDEFDTPLEIRVLPKHKLAITLQGQYRVEHLDELLDMMDEDQRSILERYMADPSLSSRVIVLSGDRIIDGNHRALAAALKGVPINYVDLADLEDGEVSEAKVSTVAKDLEQVTGEDLRGLLGKGAFNALIKHPWMSDWGMYTKAWKHGVRPSGHHVVEMYPYMPDVHTVDGKIRPEHFLRFIISHFGKTGSIVQVEKWYRPKEPSEVEKKHGPSAAWKHVKSWKKDEELNEGADGIGYAIHLGNLKRFFKGEDPLADLVPERRTHSYALHSDIFKDDSSAVPWRKTFSSLTGKDFKEVLHNSKILAGYRPKKFPVPPGTLVGDMHLANLFYSKVFAKTPEEKKKIARQYKESLAPFEGADLSKYVKPELLIPRGQNLSEGFEAEADAYKSHLIKTMPLILDLLSRTIKDWKPSKEELLDAIEIGYNVMRTTGSKQEAGKALGDKLKSLHMSSQRGVAEGKQQVERNGIQLNVSIDGATVDIRPMINGNQVGYVVFDRDGETLVADDLAIDEEYRRRGIAKIIYDYLKELGFTVKRSTDQLPAGKAFWDKYKGAQGQVWEDDHVDEMALASYKTMGDFTKQGPFTGADKRLVPHPKNIEKATRFFEQTPFDFRLFFSNIPGTGKYSEHGPMTPDELRKVFGKDAEEIIAGSEDAITVVYVGNKGDRKVMLTPWMMAHRFGHAINAGSRNQNWSTWIEAERYFFKTINNLLKEYYSKEDKNPSPYSKRPNRPKSEQMSGNLTLEYNVLFNTIGTQRSSSSGQIRRPYEFMYELLAQYIGTGKITLNPFPENLKYKLVYGNPTMFMNIKPEYRDEGERKQAADSLAYTMELLFNNVLGDSVGKIFVM